MTKASELHGVLVVDKALGPTSHDVVSIARRVLGTREIGHTGTLDPMATGVLVLVVGEATKLVNVLTAHTKRYEATVRLGAATRTLDAQGEVEATAPIPALTRAQVESAAATFVGEIEQRAPIVSAIKVAGKSLHKRARSGEQVEAPVRRVRLDALEIRALRAEEIDLAVTCGSGFYVRSLARDLAERLGTLGHLTALRRTQNGAFGVADAVTFDTLHAGKTSESVRDAVRARVIPLTQVCGALPNVTLDEDGVKHARHGRAIPLACAQGGDDAASGTRVARDERSLPIALVERSLDHWRIVRGFRAP
jgi:tRNA pseudouridine55 synthase